MALDSNQLLDLKARFEDANPGKLGAITVTSGGGETRTLAEFLALGNADVLFSAVNDLSIGIHVGAMVGRSAITGQEIWGAIMIADEYKLQMKDVIPQLLPGIPSGQSLLDMTDTVLISAIESLLENFPDAVARFKAKKQAPGTVNDAYYVGAIEQTDIYALVALV